MQFNNHFNLAGKHAFLSASGYHWIRYDDEKLDIAFGNSQAAMLGSKLHEFAHNAVLLGIKLPRTRRTLNLYVNDAIGFRMQTEQVLYYSDNCFCTADAISFKNNFLRIHDLKTGITKASMDQLKIYAAVFCLEYGYKPFELEIELRIYKDDDIEILIPESSDISEIMEIIIRFDRRIELLKAEGLVA